MASNLESLVTVLEQILKPADQKRWILDQQSRPQIESLLEISSSLKKILWSSSSLTNGQKESLESRIRDAAHKAEDIIESHVVDQMLSMRGAKSCIISPPDLQQVIQELDSAKDQMMKAIDAAASNQMGNILLPVGSGSSFKPDPSSTTTNNVVGLDEDLHWLKDRLTGLETKLEIIPIVGMGGIGKTTLARKLYNDEHIVSHFDTRAWITISQNYNVREILLGILGCLVGKLSGEILQQKNKELAVILHQCLWGKRYLIVLDDMWSANAWDDIHMFFPKDKNRSRLILTTRESDVANHVDASSAKHEMHLLNEPESWELLREKVFGKEDCPASFERIGKNIARSCRGLPLAINVIAGLLSKAKKTKDSWEHVAYDIRAAIADEKDEGFSNILSLSYNHLPDHLKPCFLYIAAFPEDCVIRASKLIKLWVAEGFLKSNGDKSLEEAAEDYLKALADRNLLFVREKKSNGRAKSYGIHDLLRDLCVKKADQERFLNVQNRQVHNTGEDSLYGLRRVSTHPSFRIRNILYQQEFMSFARTFLCIGLISRMVLSPVFFALKLLRVLDMLDIEFHQFPTEILELVNLRYLALFCNVRELPSEMSELWNLQTLILQSSWYSVIFPSEIWELTELRHIKLKNAYVSAPNCNPKSVLEKLQTIDITGIGLGYSDILAIIPNIKYLGIHEYREPTFDLRHLHKLETLKWRTELSPFSREYLSTLRFPPSLKKLTLIECTIPWGYMETISSLDNLEVLKIRECYFEGQEIDDIEYEESWEATGEEFGSLKYLLLENLKLVHWKADESHFPRLERLVIRDCSALKKIPSGIGEIPSLELIELDKSCRLSAVASVEQIREDQRDYGNDSIQLRILP